MSDGEAKRHHSVPPCTGRFVIPCGTKAKVRRVGALDWQPFVTTKTVAFDQHGVADNGGTWTFLRDGYELKVATCFVRGREPKALPPRDGVSYGGVADASGKRASRRRNGWGR